MEKSGESRFFRSELGLRILSAIVLIALVLPAVWYGGWAMGAVAGALSALVFYEWLLITGRFDPARPTPGIQWLIGGLAYAAIPVATLPFIRGATEPSGWMLLMLLFIVVWATDVAAYFVGRRFGGPKLAPAISPNKTWSGAIGGALAAMLVGLVFSLLYPYPMSWFILASFAMSVFSQVGDLFESWIKRVFDVKDSSRLIPGHGGFLDRVDGLLGAALPMALYVWLT